MDAIKYLRHLALLAFSSAALVGCGTVPIAPANLDSQAKTFTPEPGKASIYVMRGGSIRGYSYVIKTVLDGRLAGSLARDTYQLVSVPPGEHDITVTSSENEQRQKLTAEAGKNYFFKVSVAMGWMAPRVHIEAASEEEGRRQVSGSKRAETTTYQ